MRSGIESVAHGKVLRGGYCYLEDHQAVRAAIILKVSVSLFSLPGFRLSQEEVGLGGPMVEVLWAATLRYFPTIPTPSPYHSLVPELFIHFINFNADLGQPALFNPAAPYHHAFANLLAFKIHYLYAQASVSHPARICLIEREVSRLSLIFGLGYHTQTCTEDRGERP